MYCIVKLKIVKKSALLVMVSCRLGWMFGSSTIWTQLVAGVWPALDCSAMQPLVSFACSGCTARVWQVDPLEVKCLNSRRSEDYDQSVPHRRQRQERYKKLWHHTGRLGGRSQRKQQWSCEDWQRKRYLWHCWFLIAWSTARWKPTFCTGIPWSLNCQRRMNGSIVWSCFCRWCGLKCRQLSRVSAPFALLQVEQMHGYWLFECYRTCHECKRNQMKGSTILWEAAAVRTGRLPRLCWRTWWFLASFQMQSLSARWQRAPQVPWRGAWR